MPNPHRSRCPEGPPARERLINPKGPVMTLLLDLLLLLAAVLNLATALINRRSASPKRRNRGGKRRR